MLLLNSAIVQNWMRHYFITRSWLVSLTARKIYRATAVASLSVVIFPTLYRTLGEQALAIAWVDQVLRLGLLIAVLSTATTLVAMEYYFFAFDNSGAWVKTFWFLIAWLPPFGTALYCFLVYSRSDYFRGIQAEAGAAAAGKSGF